MFSKIWSYYLEFGARALLVRIRRALYHEEIYLLYTKQVGDSDWPGEYEDVRFRVGTLDDVDLLSRNWPSHLNYVGKDVQAVLRARIEGGEIPVIGTVRSDENELIFMSWLAFRDFALLAFFDGKVPEGNVCVKNIIVFPEHRGRGIGKRGLKFMESVARNSGAKRIWVFVPPSNIASQKLHERIGYEKHSEIRFVERLGRKYVRLYENGIKHRISLQHIPDHLK